MTTAADRLRRVATERSEEFKHLARLALRNVFRHRGRTLLTLTVIVAGTVGLMLSGGFIRDALVQLREATIHSQLGHLQISHKGFYAEGSHNPYAYAIERPDAVTSVVRRTPGVVDVLSRLQFAGVINNGRSDYAIVGEGVEPDKEAALGSLIQIVEGRVLADGDHHGILIGEGVASAMKLHTGDHATLLLNTADGALNTVDFEIVGVFRSFSKDYDAHAVRVDLAASQELVASSSINVVVVSLHRTEDTDAVAARLRDELNQNIYEVKTWRELADFYDKTAALYERQFVVLQGIILVAVFLSVFNSVNMSVFERTGEFGTLMALGTRTGSLFRLIVLENLLLGLTGSCVGVLIGLVASAAISAIGIPMPPPPNSSTGYVAAIRLDAGIVGIAWLVGIVATVVASLLPARRVSRIHVSAALRAN